MSTTPPVPETATPPATVEGVTASPPKDPPPAESKSLPRKVPPPRLAGASDRKVRELAAQVAELGAQMEAGARQVRELLTLLSPLTQRLTAEEPGAAVTVAAEPRTFAPSPPPPEGVVLATQDTSARVIQASAPQRDPTRPITPEGNGVYLAPELRTGLQHAAPEAQGLGPRQAERTGAVVDTEGVRHARAPAQNPNQPFDVRESRTSAIPAPPPGVLNFEALQGISAPTRFQGAERAPALAERPSATVVAAEEQRVTAAAPGSPVTVAASSAGPSAGAPVTPAPAGARVAELLHASNNSLTAIQELLIEAPDSVTRASFLEGVQDLRRATARLAQLATQGG